MSWLRFVLKNRLRVEIELIILLTYVVLLLHEKSHLDNFLQFSRIFRKQLIFMVNLYWHKGSSYISAWVGDCIDVNFRFLSGGTLCLDAKVGFLFALFLKFSFLIPWILWNPNPTATQLTSHQKFVEVYLQKINKYEHSFKYSIIFTFICTHLLENWFCAWGNLYFWMILCMK